MALSKHTCYVLRFVTYDGEAREYFGETEIRGTQTPKQACSIRLRYHLTKPLEAMARGVQSSFDIEAMGRPLSKKNCLLQEAINTAVALKSDTSVRGACYSCRILGSFLRNSAAQIRSVVRNLHGQAARDALETYVARLDSDHPLAKHIAGASYKETHVDMITLPTRSRSRSGKPGNQTRKRQLKRGEYKRGDKMHVRLKRGRDPVQRRHQEETVRLKRKVEKERQEN